ncbi:beta-1,6-N-acetylglucosaminyltransferase [Mangrovimonas aestuarii]|uniref:beta-1,6-N-acetylglucosaminyltransferase n=1 Tax=Mangrovimonas aestuarii TaxID=3018443 RepID=UPI00237936FB|nr:beta-1,6-N-acetylglucosaminyltransferase [Mangrovimonas aestuarii]
MKQAILITAYKNLHHLKDIILFFDDEDFELFIHIDKKSVLSVSEIEKLRAYKHVTLISRKYKVNWGGVNHLKCILHLSQQALNNGELKYFHLISGHDFPIKTLQEFKDFAVKNVGNSYISNFTLPTHHWFDGGLNRLEYYNFYDLLDGKKRRGTIFKLVRYQKKIGFKRPISKKMPQLYGGETWWSLSREALQYVVDYTLEKPRLLKRFRHTFCSEEMYFQTVVMNSVYSKKVVNHSLRYIDWNSRNGNDPANLDTTDFDTIIKSDCLFARKFEFPVSQDLKEKLLVKLAKDYNPTEVHKR